jgi:hypothetical protein
MATKTQWIRIDLIDIPVVKGIGPPEKILTEEEKALLRKGDKGDQGDPGKDAAETHLGDLQDVSISKPQPLQVLTYTKAGWENQDPLVLWQARDEFLAGRDGDPGPQGPRGPKGDPGGGGGSINPWADFSPVFAWGTADPTITNQKCEFIQANEIVFFNIYLLISDGKGASSLTISLPVATSQIVNYKIYPRGYKIIAGSIRSDPYPYIDYNEAVPLIKFDAFGTLQNTKTAELNINGQYKVS